MQGKIIKIVHNQFTVKSDDIYVCNASGKIKKYGNNLLVGDTVIFDNNYITEVLPRKNSLIRPPISNIDNALIVTSTHIPNFDSNLLDKLLCIIEYNNIKPIICFTKIDLLDDDKKKYIMDIIAYYKKIGYDVFDNTEIEKIKEKLKNKITVFTGQTGAGKSTLLNKIDSSLNLKTSEVSLSLGRGKHTTRHVELLNVNDMLIADTPGFSSLDFYDMTKEDIRDNFIEFNLYRDKCQYKDCMHNSEEICEIKKQVDEKNILEERYLNYLNFIKNERK